MLKILVYALLLALALTLGAQSANAQEDIAPPVLHNVSFEPEAIDTSKAPAVITVTVHTSDDLSGVAWVTLRFRKPGTTQEAYVDLAPESGRGAWAAGDARDGQIVHTMTVPQYAAFGTWELYQTLLVDRVGNRVEQEKPADGKLAGPDAWPTLYNGFMFSVATGTDEPKQTELYLFLPSINH